MIVIPSFHHSPNGLTHHESDSTESRNSFLSRPKTTTTLESTLQED